VTWNPHHKGEGGEDTSGLHNRVRRQSCWRKTVLGAAGLSAEDDWFSWPNGWRTFQKGPGGRPRGTHPPSPGTYIFQTLRCFPKDYSSRTQQGGFCGGLPQASLDHRLFWELGADRQQGGGAGPGLHPAPVSRHHGVCTFNPCLLAPEKVELDSAGRGDGVTGLASRPYPGEMAPQEKVS